MNLLRFLSVIQFLLRSRASVVDVAVRLLWTVQPKNSGSSRGRVNRVFSSAACPDGSGALPALCLRGASASSSREKIPELEAVDSSVSSAEIETQ